MSGSDLCEIAIAIQHQSRSVADLGLVHRVGRLEMVQGKGAHAPYHLHARLRKKSDLSAQMIS